MANVRALVHSTISTMLHNLKDGQVYISVDDVHQYLKNAGNTTKVGKSINMDATAVIMEPKERKMYTMMQQLRTVRNVKTKKRKLIEKNRNESKQKERERIAAQFAVIEKEKKKKKMALEGAERNKKAKFQS